MTNEDTPRPTGRRKIIVPDDQPATTPAVDRAAARPQRRRDQLNPVFLICLAVGSVLAVIGHNPALSLVGLLGPILMTAFYPVWGLYAVVRSRPSQRERLADNSYYLGFIFTQAALLVAFGLPIILRQPIESADVLRGFGVAIGASMTGLIARTLLVQSGLTANENVDLVEQEVESLAREVERLSKGVSQHTRGIIKEVEGIATNLSTAREQLDANLKGWTIDLARTLEEYDRGLRTHTAAAETAAGAVEGATSSLRSGMVEGQGELAKSISGAVEAISSMKEGMAAQISEVSRAIRDSRDLISGGAQAVGGLQDNLRATLSDAADVVRDATEGVSKSAEALKGLDRIEGLAGKLDHGADRIESGLSAMAATVGNASVKFNTLAGDASASLARALSTAQAELDATRAELLERTRTMGVDAIERTQAETQALSDDLNRAVAALEEVLRDFRTRLERANV
jgi:hypothetical protein